MAKILIRLKDMPDDEAREIRELLDAQKVDYYETSAGNWGMSMAAIWVRDEARFPQIRRLLDDYQIERAARVRAEYAQAVQDGEVDTLWHRLWRRPLTVLMLLAVIAFVIYFSISPYLIEAPR